MGFNFSLPTWARGVARCVWVAGIAWAAGASAFGQAAVTPRVVFSGSFKEVPVSAAAAATAPRHAWLLRRDLHADEIIAPVTFEVALRMRNFPALEDRLARGELISRNEMEATYYPLAGDYQRVTDWIRSQGLDVTRIDADRLAVFGRGSVAAVAQAFQVTFARVTADDGDYTAAISAPSLPGDLASAVVGIHGLQPHLRVHRMMRPGQVHSDAGGTTVGYLPAQIATAYNSAGTGLTGAGQTIAILSGAFAQNTDLTAFWTAAGVSNSTGHIQNITVNTGPEAGDTESQLEASLDVEWASALAPGAVIRVYGANFNDPNFFDEILQQIFADLPAVPSMHQVSISYGASEVGSDRDYIIILSQYAANLASAGVTILCASGDDGAAQGGVLQVSVPTSDPNVTGVGGTTVSLTSTGGVTSETGWSGSGGGVSQVFSRPSWQTGTGVPAGAMRLVPDVAAAANASNGAEIIDAGVTQSVSGTSWATPIWAAFCALLNQSRSAAGQSPLGNLNARIYALIGSSAFRDITVGNNGNYNAGVGYDLVTGVGVPNIAVLAQTATSASSAPAVYSQLGGQTVTLGQPATFFVVGSGAPPLAYQWQRLAAGTSAWTSLADNSTYSGSATGTLVVNGATYAMNRDQFQCIVTNAFGTTVSAPADLLLVNPVGVTTLAGWPQFWGTANGTGWAARFEFPGGLREDASGNLYVADGNAATVRKVTQAGVVTTFAGIPGMSGSTDGPVASALLGTPSGVAIDSAGNVYVADASNFTIRKITPGGVVSTLAGSPGLSASVDAVGSAARFVDPEDVAVDASGNLYVPDGTGNRIRKVAPDGTVSTLAGSGTEGSANGAGAAATFNDPLAVGVDSAGNVYVADSANNQIRKVTGGIVTTIAGSGRTGGTDGPAASARFSSPTGVSVDASGNIYVADSGNDTIRLITPAGIVSTVAGTVGAAENIDGPNAAAEFSLPAQVFPDPSGVLFVADAGNGTIRRIVPGALAAPQILTAAPAVTVNSGQNAVFAITVSGSVPLTYQWQQLLSGASAWVNLTDGASVSGSATPTLTLSGVTVPLFGSQYQCIVQNNAGSVISAASTLSVLGPPAVSTTAQTHALPAGTADTLSVAALGPALAYQWLLNGVPIAGAVNPTYLISSFSAATAGVYSVLVSNGYGSTSATVATLTLASARLVNLSARANSSTGGGVLAAGFIVGGSGSKQILLRGIGPTLGTFGVSGVLPDPTLTWFNAASVSLATDTGWGGTAALMAAFNASGAFALPSGSADSALLETATPNSYTIQVAGATGDSGNALAEIYDLDSISAPARLINLSSRSLVTGGTGFLTAGFVIAGGGTETVLIRGDGPALANYGVSNFLSSPVITLFDAKNNVLATNAGWGGSASLSATFTQVGAFALSPGSNDAAMVISLPSGNYTVQVTGAGASSGVALVEIYEVPQ